MCKLFMRCVGTIGTKPEQSYRLKNRIRRAGDNANHCFLKNRTCTIPLTYKDVGNVLNDADPVERACPAGTT